MIDLDIYLYSPVAEEILQSFKANVNKHYHPIKIYISTASHGDDWLQKLYIFYNNTNLMEELK